MSTAHFVCTLRVPVARWGCRTAPLVKTCACLARSCMSCRTPDRVDGDRRRRHLIDAPAGKYMGVRPGNLVFAGSDRSIGVRVCVRVPVRWCESSRGMRRRDSTRGAGRMPPGLPRRRTHACLDGMHMPGP